MGRIKQWLISNMTPNYMAKNNLLFPLPRLEEIIEPDFVTTSAKTLVIEAIKQMKRAELPQTRAQPTEGCRGCSTHSCIFVLEESQLVGVLTEQDLVKLSATVLNWERVPVGEVMTRNVITFPKTEFQHIYQILAIFQQQRLRHLPLVDESGKLEGLITAESICSALKPSNWLASLSLEKTMNSEVILAAPTSSVFHLTQLMAEKRPSCVVIVEPQFSPSPSGSFPDGSSQTRLAPSSSIPLGLVRERELVQFQLLGLEATSTTARDLISTPLICRKTTDSWLEVQKQMNKLKVFWVVVRDESGALQGIITPREIMRVYESLWLFSAAITPTKLLETQLKSSQAQMRAIFEAMTDLVLTVDLSQDSLQVLPTKFLALDQEDTLGQIIAQIQARLFDSPQAEGLRSRIQPLWSTQQTIDFESSLPLNDSLVWFSVNISPLSPTKSIWVVRDITQRKQMEQNLFVEKELAQVTLKSIGDAVITTEPNGRVQYLNPVAEQLTGWSVAEARGRSLLEVWSIREQLTRKPLPNPVTLVGQQKQPSQLPQDTLLIAKDGTEYAIEASAAPIKNRPGQIMGAVIVFRDVTQSRQLAQQLSWQAHHDPLTGLYNRRKFEDLVNLAIQESRLSESEHALCYFDLDRFKIVNDTCGHAAGDEVLKQITQLCQKRIRAADILARLGGDEFALLLRHCPLAMAAQMAEGIRLSIQDFRFAWKDKMFSLGVSIGLVAIDSRTENLTSLLSTADAACYAAKEKGRNCIHLYHSQDLMVAQQRGERQWIDKLNRAIAQNRFCLYKQKIVSLEDNGSSPHYEILLRLIDESGQLIVPGVFFPAAERYGLLPALDRWVLATFFASYEVYCQSRTKLPLEPNPPLYHLNLSGASINNQEMATFLQEQFQLYSLPYETICFEIKETVALSHLHTAVTFIDQLKQWGCSLALDDFGSGLSSFAHLKNFPVDYLKIDGRVIENMVQEPINYATVECFHRLSQLMNIQTIAEFVEDHATWQSLKQIGINYAQGYAIEPPQPLVFA